ncbi:hypothetical protein D3C84_1260220 [compost metagenome]
MHTDGVARRGSVACGVQRHHSKLIGCAGLEFFREITIDARINRIVDLGDLFAIA